MHEIVALGARDHYTMYIRNVIDNPPRAVITCASPRKTMVLYLCVHLKLYLADVSSAFQCNFFSKDNKTLQTRIFSSKDELWIIQRTFDNLNNDPITDVINVFIKCMHPASCIPDVHIQLRV